MLIINIKRLTIFLHITETAIAKVSVRPDRLHMILFGDVGK